MNIYEKLIEARKQVKEAKLKKSGENTFAKYTYYELEDILPTITEICAEVKIVPIVSFNNDLAVLTIYDTESADKIEFSSPMVESEVKGATKIQNLGAVETYQRRYLYMTAFEIVETDANDRLTQDDSLHNIFAIKGRVEKAITEKIGQLYPEYSKKEPHETNAMNKAMTWYGIEMRTMMDDTTSKIAELLLQGTNMGIIEGRRLLNHKDTDKDVHEIVQAYVDMQEEAVEKLKKYL